MNVHTQPVGNECKREHQNGREKDGKSAGDRAKKTHTLSSGNGELMWCTRRKKKATNQLTPMCIIYPFNRSSRTVSARTLNIFNEILIRILVGIMQGNFTLSAIIIIIHNLKWRLGMGCCCSNSLIRTSFFAPKWIVERHLTCIWFFRLFAQIFGRCRCSHRELLLTFLLSISGLRFVNENKPRQDKTKIVSTQIHFDMTCSSFTEAHGAERWCQWRRSTHTQYTHTVLSLTTLYAKRTNMLICAFARACECVHEGVAVGNSPFQSE